VDDALYAYVQPTGPASAKVTALAHSTTYRFRVQAEDTSGNDGPSSGAVTATTLASVDTTPPSAPSNVFAFDYGCALFELTWTESQDNTDPAFAIRYDIYVNGATTPAASVTGDTITDVQTSPGTSTFVIKAVDRSGNTSQPSSPATGTDRCG
jgi:hypothetical protein